MTTPTTINDITDLLRILRNNPEWLDQVRNVVLTEEILQLPAALAALTQEVREFIVERRAINQEQKRTNDAVFARLDRIRADVVEAKSDIKELKTTVNRVDGVVGQLLGEQAERRVHANIHGFLRSHDHGLEDITILKSINQSLEPKLSNQIAQASRTGLINQDEEEHLQVVDLVVQARPYNSNQVVYYAIEISVVVDETDVRRAAERAEILSRATNTKTVPVTVGVVTIPAATALAETHGVVTITTPQLT